MTTRSQSEQPAPSAAAPDGADSRAPAATDGHPAAPASPIANSVPPATRTPLAGPATGIAKDRTLTTGDADAAAASTPTPRSVPSPDDPTRTSTGRPDDQGSEPAPRDDDRLPAPLQFRDPDRYQILGEHGRGGLGRVFRARDKELGRDVAVKELLHRGNTSELRFFREALITARLEHPGIVPVHEAGRWPDGTPFYAMKLVQGRPLKALIDECKTLEERLALLPHIIAVADAIAYAHDRKIIHRDLKPSNVIVGDFGETVVIDWGLAKDLSAAEDERAEPGTDTVPAQGEGLTIAGSVLGTPAYMAPEQARAEPVDARADVYAIGVMIWDIVGAAGQERSKRRGATHDLTAIAACATEHKRERRYQSAQALADDLRRFQSNRPVTARHYSLFDRITLGSIRHRRLVLLLMAFLLVVTAISTIAALRIARQRADAEAARSRERATRLLAEQAATDATLRQAEALLATDPTAAVAALQQLTKAPNPDPRAALLVARAQARGVAVRTLSLGRLGSIQVVGELPDGTIVSVTGNRLIHVSRTNGETSTIATPPAESLSGSFAPDGGHFAIAQDQGLLLVETATETSTLLPLPGRSIPLAISPDGIHLLIFSWDSSDDRDWDRASLLLLDLTKLDLAATASATRRIPMRGPLGAFFPDPHHIVTASQDRGTYLLDEANDWQPRLVAPGGYATPFSFTPTHVALSAPEGDIVTLDLTTGTATTSHTGCNGRMRDLALTHDATTLYESCSDGSILASDQGKTRTIAHLENPCALLLPPDDSQLICATGSEVVTIDTHTLLTMSLLGHAGEINGATLSHDGTTLLTSDTFGSIRVWKLDQPHVQQIETTGGDFLCSVDEQTVAVTNNDGELLISRNNKLVARFHDQYFPETCAVDKTSPTFATGGADGSLVVRRNSDFSVVGQLHVHTTQMVFAYSDDGDIASCGADGRVVLWSPATDTHRVLLPASSVTLKSCDWHNKDVVTTTSAGDLIVLHGPDYSRTTRKALNATPVMVEATAGDYLVIGTSTNQLIRISTNDWSIEAETELPSPIAALSTSRGSHVVAVVTADGTGHVLDSETLMPPGDWSEFPLAGLSALFFSPDGTTLAAAFRSGEACIASSAHDWSCMNSPWGRLNSTHYEFGSGDTQMLAIDAFRGIISFPVGSR
ncbi:MAG: protein kinase [Kofleriaceae bacterium]|nr:protein kinase [Kofleriaceae bacterium]